MGHITLGCCTLTLLVLVHSAVAALYLTEADDKRHPLAIWDGKRFAAFADGKRFPRKLPAFFNGKRILTFADGKRIPKIWDGKRFAAFADGKRFLPAYADGKRFLPAYADGKRFLPAYADGKRFPAFPDGKRLTD